MTEHETNPQRHETPGPPTGPEPSHQPADASFESSSPERGPSEPTTAAQPTVPHQPVSPWQQQPYAQPQPGYSPHPGYGGYPGAQYPQYGQQYAGTTYGGHTEQHPAWAAPVATDTLQPGAGRGRKILAAGAAAVLIALAGGGVGAATVLAMDDDNGTAPVQTGNSSVSRVVDRSSLASIAAAAQDSVVSITTGNGEGSGVILKADGYILTNNHVVATARGATVSVIFADGKKATATIVGTDPRTDLAVIKADGVSGLKPATFGKSADMQVGDTVLALGSPLGLEGSVTSGIISAKDRTIRSGGEDQNPFGGQQQQATTTMSGLLQTDAPINPGNSGGALVNTNAQVIGINTAIATSGQGAGNIGLGFAIPSDRAIQVANDLMAGRKVSHPQLGVNVAAAENGGALVTNVQPDSAAARAGLQQGDVITTANGKPINDSDDLVAIVQAGKVGDQVAIQFTRDGAQKAVTATLAEAD